MNDIPVWKLFVMTYTKEIIVFAVCFCAIVALQLFLLVKRRNFGINTFRNFFATKDGLTGLPNSV